MSNAKKFRNVTVSVEESTVAPGQVVDLKITGARESGGVILEHRSFSFPAGRVQQQQMFPGTNSSWQNVGPELVHSAPTTAGFEIPLNGNTAVQYIWVGP